MDPARASPRPILLPALLGLVVAGTLLQGALTPRDLSLGEDAATLATDGDLAAFALSRVVTALALVISLLSIATASLRAGLPRAGLGLWLSFLALVVTGAVLPALAGQERGLDLRLLSAPVVFSAVYVARPLGPDGLVRAGKLALGAFLFGSLAAAALAPAHALAEDYDGLLGLAFRLYGVGGGATSLGAQAAAYLALEAAAPSPGRSRWLGGGAALLVLILTQSKTAWAFVLLGAAALGWRALERRLVGEAPPAGLARVWRGLLRAALVAGLLGAGLGAATLLADAATLTAGNLGTLTGRTVIWETTLRLWQASPVFGYGVGLWDTEAFRAEHGQFAHAHNQVLHVLGSAGLIGLLGLAAYLRTAWRLARGAAPRFAAPLALLALTLVQCLTEVPLRHPYLLDAHTVLHLLLFAALVQAAHLEPAGAQPDR